MKQSLAIWAPQVEPGPLVGAIFALWMIPLALWPSAGVEVAAHAAIYGTAWSAGGFVFLMASAAVRTGTDTQSSLCGVLRHAALLVAWPAWLAQRLITTP